MRGPCRRRAGEARDDGPRAVARPMLRLSLQRFAAMFDADTMTALLWLSVIAGYAWSVWSLDRLCRRADADHGLLSRQDDATERRPVIPGVLACSGGQRLAYEAKQ